MKTLMTIAITFLLLSATPLLRAQGDTIIANPNAQKLRVIWLIEGAPEGGTYVGDYAGGLGDIYGTGYSAWGVHIRAGGHTYIYAGGPEPLSTTPVDSLVGGGIRGHLITGDFWGTRKPAVCALVGRIEQNTSHYFLRIYQRESTGLATTPALNWDSWKVGVTGVEVTGPKEILAADLDGDHADELIVVCPANIENGQRSTYALTLIYRGGADFQVDSPAVVIRDSDDNNDLRYVASTADADGDGYDDLVFGAIYRDHKAKLKFYWGSDSALSTWRDPDRIVPLDDGAPPLGLHGPRFVECDGDGVADLLLGGGPTLFRSGNGTDIRTRPLLLDSADVRWRGPGGDFQYASGGYINDSLRRYQSTLLYVGTGYWFSGGPQGPDGTFEAYYTTPGETLFGDGGPIGDANGDGWEDFLTANWGYGGFNKGAAAIFAGGPYIPHDSTWLGVRDVATDAHHAAISVWPNPVRDELNIAWRGDLKRMLHRLVVSDMLGRRIAEGEVNPWQGAALWRCASVATGAYLLTIYDSQREIIATAKILKERE